MSRGDRLPRLQEFWGQLGQRVFFDQIWTRRFLGNCICQHGTIAHGVPGFFEANPSALLGRQPRGGCRTRGIYSTDPLRQDPDCELVDFDYLNDKATRLTVGAVNVNTSELKYFDTRDMDSRAGAYHGLGGAAARLPGGLHRR